MFNSTLQLNNFNSSYSPITKLIIDEIFSDILYAFISFIGILSNFIAMLILSSTSSIRKSRPYTLLMNQCIMDVLSALSGTFNVIGKYSLKREGLRGLGYELYCNIVHNQLGVAIHVCASSYNLAALSMERMFSVVWPIRHRISFTPTNIKTAAVSIWIFSIAIMLAHSIGINSIGSNGRCEFWNVKAGIRSKVFAITFNFTISCIPFMIMLVCYVTMYARIIAGRLKVKMNIIRVLGSCIALFFICHAPRAILSIITRYSDSDLVTKSYFNATLAILIVNNFVNPVVYLLQYKDYKFEFRRQVNRLMGCKMASVEPSISTMISLQVSSKRDINHWLSFSNYINIGEHRI